MHLLQVIWTSLRPLSCLSFLVLPSLSSSYPFLVHILAWQKALRCVRSSSFLAQKFAFKWVWPKGSVSKLNICHVRQGGNAAGGTLYILCTVWAWHWQTSGYFYNLCNNAHMYTNILPQHNTQYTHTHTHSLSGRCGKLFAQETRLCLCSLEMCTLSDSLAD